MPGMVHVQPNRRKTIQIQRNLPQTHKLMLEKRKPQAAIHDKWYYQRVRTDDGSLQLITRIRQKAKLIEPLERSNLPGNSRLLLYYTLYDLYIYVQDYKRNIFSSSPPIFVISRSYLLRGIYFITTQTFATVTCLLVFLFKDFEEGSKSEPKEQKGRNCTCFF